MELRFLEPPRETKIGSRNRELRNIGGKIIVKTSPRKTTFGSRNRFFEKSRVREIAFFCFNEQAFFSLKITDMELFAKSNVVL